MCLVNWLQKKTAHGNLNFVVFKHVSLLILIKEDTNSDFQRSKTKREHLILIKYSYS